VKICDVKNGRIEEITRDMNGKKDRTRIDRFRVFWTVLAAVVLLVVPSMRINAADGYIAK
jgi:hypothetical protein